MDIPRCIAGVMAGTASLILIYQGNLSEGALIAMAMLAFFVGEKNGSAKAKKEG